MELLPLPTVRPPIMARKYVVASGHYLATLAGVRILEMGGNVVDAGVATGLCLNMVQPDMTNLGGVALIILRQARSGEIVTISGLGRWPRTVTLDALHRRGGVGTGIVTSVVPAALDAWILALDLCGTMPFGEVAAPAIEFAEEGFPVKPVPARQPHPVHGDARPVAVYHECLPQERAGAPVGERLVQSELAATLRILVEAEHGATGRHEGLQAVRNPFYKGEIARRMAAFCEETDGFLTYEDLATFHVKVEPPVMTAYRGYDIYACGPWCQGPVVLETRLRHVPIEGLPSKAYAAPWRLRIRPESAFPDRMEPRLGSRTVAGREDGRASSGLALSLVGPGITGLRHDRGAQGCRPALTTSGAKLKSLI